MCCAEARRRRPPARGAQRATALSLWLLAAGGLAAAADAGPVAGVPEPVVLEASDGVPGELFGQAVAISGDRLAVGAPEHAHPGRADDGAVYVFENQAGAWVEVVELVPPDTATVDFGAAVALDGDFLAVGDPGYSSRGAVYVFERTGDGAWIPVAELPGEEIGEDLGSSVDLDGETLVAGAPRAGNDQEGAADVYERDELGGWSRTARLEPEDPGEDDDLGRAVAVSGDTVAVGVPGRSDGLGEIVIHERDAGGTDAWGRTATVVVGNTEGFGTAVALAGDVLAVGAPEVISGAAWLFERDLGGADAWGLLHRRTPRDAFSGDDFARSLALDDATLFAGAPLDGPGADGGSGAGHAFGRDALAPGAWAQIASFALDLPSESALGAAVDVDRDLALLGAPGPESVFLDDLLGRAYLVDLAETGPFADFRGECPGVGGLGIADAPAEADVAIYRGSRRGAGTVPAGPCAGTPLELQDPVLAATVPSDGLGNATFTADLPASVCGGLLQVVELSACRTGNELLLPRPPVFIRYDPGAPADFFVPSDDTEVDVSIGQRFDTVSGSWVASGILSGVQGYAEIGACAGSSISVTAFGPAEGDRVEALERILVPVELFPTEPRFFTHLLPTPLEVPPSFVLGWRIFRETVYDGGWSYCVESGGDLGVRLGTLDGQGFHGVAIDDPSGDSPSALPLPGNPMVRAYGSFGPFVDTLLPVELAAPQSAEPPAER